MMDKLRGMLIGLAVGDALGALYEFDPIALNAKPEMRSVGDTTGVWTDDTSMALCLADSLLEMGGYDSYDVMAKYSDWMTTGYRSFYNFGEGIGGQTQSAIRQFIDREPIVPTTRERSTQAGNGSIMRLAPIVIATHRLPIEQTIKLAQVSARETHYSAEAEAGTEILAATLRRALVLSDKQDIVRVTEYATDTMYNDVLARVLELATQAQLKNLGGYVVDGLRIAFWAFLHYDDIAEAFEAIIRLNGDTDTNAAIYGQLAGAYYGYNAIPRVWRDILYEEKEISDLSRQLASMPSCKIIRTRFQEDEAEYANSRVIKIIQGDITTLQVDCIVNAANTNLSGGSGVCGAIFDAAGYEEMTTACQKIGHCDFGEAVLTPGFKLPAMWVVHTVGPIFSHHDGVVSDILSSCYWESLRLAQSKRLRTIAFPLISTGIYGFPKQEAIAVAVAAIRNFYEDNPRTSIGEVTLVAYDKHDYDLVRKHLLTNPLALITGVI
jgi:ADP-ribosyl-[dinitrogen reductase] hydrolase